MTNETELNRWFSSLSYSDKLLLRGGIEEIRQLKQIIKQLKETCEILSNKKTMDGIQESLKQIAEGKSIPLEELSDKRTKEKGK